MCNPRRVMIQLRRVVEEAWRLSIQQSVTVEADVKERGATTVAIPLDEELGDLALESLENVIREGADGLEPWTQDENGDYRMNLEDVSLIYSSGSRQMTIESRLMDRISATAQGVAEASGLTRGEVEAEAVARYYDDGWAGLNEDRARQLAEQQAEANLQQAIETLHREQHRAEIEATRQVAQEQAGEQARQQLTQLRTNVRSALRERLQVVIADAQERVFHTLNRTVGEAYRRSLIQMVQSNGGRVVVNEQTGSVINMELELD